MTDLERILADMFEERSSFDPTPGAAHAIRRLFSLSDYSAAERAEVFVTMFGGSSNSLTKLLSLEVPWSDYARELLCWIEQGHHRYPEAYQVLPRCMDPDGLDEIDPAGEAHVIALLQECLGPKAGILALYERAEEDRALEE